MKKISYWVMLLSCLFIKTHGINSEVDIQDGIHPYKPEFEPEVKKIAIDNIHSLVSIRSFSKGYAEREYASEFAYGSLKYATAKVYLKDNNVVGFITYDIWNPWHRKLINSELGPKAKIHHLAVDKKHQGNGYGSQLMDHAMTEFKNNSVNRAILWIVDKKLESFYARYGFEPMYSASGKFVTRLYAQMGPHPFSSLARKVIRKIFRK